MELAVVKRTAGKKSETNKMRREGNIPAVLYSKGEKGEEIAIQGVAFQKVLNKIVKGTLSSKIFNLTSGKQERKAIIKDIQYNITTYDVIHIDFEELHEDLLVTLNIPVRLINAVECVGVKLGGVLRQVLRHVRVECLPKDIPEEFQIDVRDLALGQSIKLNTLAIPTRVRLITDPNQALVTIARK